MRGGAQDSMNFLCRYPDGAQRVAAGFRTPDFIAEKVLSIDHIDFQVAWRLSGR